MAHLSEEIGLSEHAKELKRWELRQSEGGMRPDTFQPYPKLLYRAIEGPQGGVVVDDALQCQRTVRSEREESDALNSGWSVGPWEAKAKLERLQESMANAAAERAGADRRLSERAQAEAAAHDAAQGLRHDLTGPSEKKRPGRPPKTVAAAPVG